MVYINELVNGQHIQETYLVRKITVGKTKAGKDYWSVTLGDSTGSIDAKIWSPGDPNIAEFNELDYVDISANVQEYRGELQLIVSSVRKADPSEVDPADFMPSTQKSVERMYQELLSLVNSVGAPYFKELLLSFFDDEKISAEFRKHSAAKSVHHSFVGGLLEHTLSVTKICDFYSQNYSFLNRDLLITAALLHDIGKIYELNDFPANDYSDPGQLLGHIYIGAHLIDERAAGIEGFPEVKKNELVHCILSHHGKLEFGSPKEPELAEAIALSFADNADAKLETFKEAVDSKAGSGDEYRWLGFNKYLESNIRKTTPENYGEE